MTTKKYIAILGAGESGVGTALLAKKHAFEVFVSDSGKIKAGYRATLIENDIDFEEEKHTEEKILKADVVMKSPGIPDNVALVQLLKKRGVPVISEIEFAVQFTDAVIAGITGANGKTTTTMMLTHILRKANFNVGEAGNIGDSFAKQVANENYQNYVLELSSFQLDGIVDFAPHIAIITNITPDHLDRYEYTFENYIASKFRITKNQTAADFLIYDADDAVVTNWIAHHDIAAQLMPFSLKKTFEVGAFIKNDKIVIKIHDKSFEMNLGNLTVQGNHNTKNTMAASMAARLLQVRKETIRESMEDFEGAPHRLERFLKIGGVQFINDSKATNINATFYALESMRKPTVWIVGGVDKGNNYMELMPLVREKVKAIVCLGTDNTKIIETFHNVMPIIIETQGAEEAVKVAHKLAEKGDNVLLSPACASFDLFDNYEDRGNQYKEAIRKL